ncbi:MAG: formamidopyrimidine-DNA glycosylase [Chitinivibrionales bacterium]|nr:formamidopyrimidine-DNA glycosylase [Chitinivibrionales bacterium]
MPEYPDITVYIEHLERLLSGSTLEAVRIASPFVLRTVAPPLERFTGKRVCGFERIGKRIVCVCEDELFLVMHLMVAGRLHWRRRAAAIPRSGGLAACDFDRGTLLISENAKRKRASLHAVEGREALRAFDPGGIDVFDSSDEQLRAALQAENHTLKRALTDPRILSGIGNAYSDEILHRAKLSPVALTTKLDSHELERLCQAARAVLAEWTERLRREAGERFPQKVTAFHECMAVHGKYGLPCTACGTPVQRIRYAENETNYCPNCQTGGKLLADRALSRLLRGDWPRTFAELEERRRGNTRP